VVLLELSETTNPLAGAMPVSVTVPVELFPPATLVGDRLTERTAGGVMVRFAEKVAPNVPEMDAVVEDATAEVEIGKVALVVPRGTVTEEGTTAAALLLCRETTIPEGGAGELSVAVPTAELPPIREVGLRVILDNTGGGSTVRTVEALPL
jgi:hypothetical protein